MQVFEPVTPANFDARRYLLANRDLRMAFGEDAAAAKRHLHEYGLKENRHQLTKEFVTSSEFEPYLHALTGNIIEVFEPVTPANFDARRYLLANRDLRVAFGEDAAAAERHLYECGLQQSRRQVTALFLSTRHEKFAKFAPTLPECEGDSFPINFATSPHRLDEYDAESSNPSYGFWMSELDSNPLKLYADIGAGLRDVVTLNCAYVEVYPSLTADILIDPDCRLPFEDATLDGIGCFAVLEHVSRPWEMSQEFARAVKPGGKIFIDWPFLQPTHGFPSHYYNATREGLRGLFANNFDIDELYTGAWQGPDYTVSWVLNSLVSSIKDDTARTKLLQTSVGQLLEQSPQSEMWRSILDTLDDSAVSMLSCGNCLIGTRK